MMPMGTWYVATLLAQQNSGDADKFKWGIAPAPQFDASTAGTAKTPVTFGDPTGFGINAADRRSKLTAAKEFLAYAAERGRRQGAGRHRHHPGRHRRGRGDLLRSCRACRPTSCRSSPGRTHVTKPENPIVEVHRRAAERPQRHAHGGACRAPRPSTPRSPTPRAGQERGRSTSTGGGARARRPRLAAPPRVRHDDGERRRRRRRRPAADAARLGRLRNTLVGWSFILPNFLGFAVLTLVPVVTLFYYAFTDWNVFGSARPGPAWRTSAQLCTTRASGPRCRTPSTTRCSTSR